MNRKNIVKITEDYDSLLSHELRNEEINYIVNEKIEVHCEIANDRMINIVEQEKNYYSDKDEMKHKTVVTAKGYNQGDWQKYTLYHNLDKDNSELNNLINLLEKSFTHQNDYIAKTFERVEIDGKTFDADPHDYVSFCIMDIEFPDKDDVLRMYEEQIGTDYDEIIIKLD